MHPRQLIKPTTMSIITTFKCSAACDNCCFECNPKRTEKLPLEIALGHIENSISKFPSLKVVVITGGECFLDISYMSSIIKYAKSKGLICRVVTNGFWAKDKESAIELLSKLKSEGLDEINFSTGDDHLNYVPIKSIKNGISAAISLNLVTVVNIESGKDRKFNMSEFLDDPEMLSLTKNSQNRLSIINGVWMPFTKESICYLPPLDPKSYHPVMDRCTNLFTSLTISPTNRLLACCGLPVMYIRHLDLGNLSTHHIDELYDCQFDDFLKIWLFVEGPYKILTFVESKLGYNTVPELKILSHMCFYCACLFSSDKYLDVLKSHYQEKFASIMMRYNFLTKQEQIF